MPQHSVAAGQTCRRRHGAGDGGGLSALGQPHELAADACHRRSGRDLGLEQVTAERFIFTVATGRCGQNSLTELVENHVPGCYPAFEEPNIVPLLSWPFDAYERRL